MKNIFLLLFLILLVSCSQKPMYGPDKQFIGTASGGLTGAGMGAVTGFQLGASAGPGALVGAGLGAVAGTLQGIAQDNAEEDLLKLSAQTREARNRSYAHEILSEHFQRRLELHPTRDIFPADLFFDGDEIRLRREAYPLLKEIAILNRKRNPSSALVVAVYVKAKNPDSEFANYLSQGRSKAITNQLISYGLNQQRVQTRSVVLDSPILIDPDDDPKRYNQSVEFISLDR